MDEFGFGDEAWSRSASEAGGSHPHRKIVRCLRLMKVSFDASHPMHVPQVNRFSFALSGVTRNALEMPRT